MKIRKEDYPHLFEACAVICYDNGAVNRYNPAQGEYELNISPEKAEVIEHGLSQLSEDDFETFCIGEESDQAEIRERVVGLEIGHLVLNEWFNEGMP